MLGLWETGPDNPSKIHEVGLPKSNRLLYVWVLPRLLIDAYDFLNRHIKVHYFWVIPGNQLR